MVYLAIKELSKDAEDVIMVTSSIMKDTAAVGSDAVYRPNAIRALCRIIDVCGLLHICLQIFAARLTNVSGNDCASN